MNTDSNTDSTSVELENGLIRIAFADPVETVNYGEDEILRVYDTELKAPGGNSIRIEVPLRYDRARAERRDKDSPEAYAEAYRRGVKLKRKQDPHDDSVYEMGAVVFLRSRPVTPRLPKASS